MNFTKLLTSCKKRGKKRRIKHSPETTKKLANEHYQNANKMSMHNHTISENKQK